MPSRTLTSSASDLAEAERLAYWAHAASSLTWDTPWETVHHATPVDPAAQRGPEITWFAGGRLNAAVNCADRHVEAGNGEKIALYFEGEPGDRETVTYRDLTERVCQAANALTELGVGRGDRVVVYLPVLVETVVIALACARIGAVHSLVFGGFSAEALRFRVQDTGAKLVVASDGQFRRGSAVPVKDAVDAAVDGIESVEHVLIVRRTGGDIPWTQGRDVWWEDAVGHQPRTHAAPSLDAETPLFIMYTSGTTGKPKGLVHTTGGYLTQAAETYRLLFQNPDPARRGEDVHWCTADLAWVTAHTYEIYGPLANGATQVIYEGVPNAPHPGRHFEIIERYGVTSYYTAPTLVRSLRGWFPDGVPESYDLSSIRVAGTVGEAVNPEAWEWLRTQIGRDTPGGIPMVDTWWQSETGATILSPRPGDAAFKPGCAARPLPGVDVRIVHDDGSQVGAGEQGELVVTAYGPAVARGVWGDPARYYNSYWKKFADQGWFLAGDGAKYDEDGDVWILGRTDDVINISGHRLSTIEIESALVADDGVKEAGVAPVPDARTGHAAVAFVVPKDPALLGTAGTAAPGGCSDVEAARAAFVERLRGAVTEHIGPIAKPREFVFVPDVPKTRSGKIMRRLLGQIHQGQQLGDTTSLQNEECLPHVADAVRAQCRPAPRG